MMKQIKELDNKYIITDFDGVLVNLKIKWEPLKEFVKKISYKNNIKTSSLTELAIKYPEIYIKYRKKINNLVRNLEEECVSRKNWEQINDRLWEYLKNKKWSIVSNNLHTTVERILSYYEAKPEYIVGRDDVILPKPYKDGTNKILRNIKVKTTQVVYIGDKEIDEKVAKACKICFINIEFLKKII